MTDFKITRLEWLPRQGLRYNDPARNILPEVGSLVVHWETPYDFTLGQRLERLQYHSYAAGQALRIRPEFSGFLPMLAGELEIYPALPAEHVLQVVTDQLYALLMERLGALLTPEAGPDAES